MSSKITLRSTAAFCCGALSLLLTGLLTSTVLAFSGEAFLPVAKVILLAHLPVMIIEGLITMFVVNFIMRVRPELFTMHR